MPVELPPRLLALALLRSTGAVVDRGAWVDEDRVLGCAFPRRERALAELARRRITLLVNLHWHPHDPARLARYGFQEVHLPVRGFAPPTPAQLERGIAAISAAVQTGHRVAVHCRAGQGRTGTLLACYLVHQGVTPEEAIGRVRAARPGSIDTPAQVVAVHAWAREGSGA